LPFSRKELEAYAEEQNLRSLSDPSNRDLSHPRNFLRHTVLPMLEDGPFPKARESLHRLARLAQENEDAWEGVMPGLLERILGEDEVGEFVVRTALLAYHPALQSRLLREVLLRAGIQLDEAGTRAALEFTRTGVSGGGLSLPGGSRFVRDFDRFRIGPAESSGENRPLLLSEPVTGSGGFILNGVRYLAAWGTEVPVGCTETVELPLSSLSFPLELRGWVSGDRIVLPFGTKKLKKLFAEAKTPSSQRSQIPVLVDAEGEILWVAGLASSSAIETEKDSGTYFLGVKRDRE
jgi:tRNA(Ile)-lysidine synthase